jgi:hypothetical protein
VAGGADRFADGGGSARSNELRIRLLGDLQLARVLRIMRLVLRAFLIVRKGPEFCFQAQVLFARFGCPAHAGKAMVFRSHRPIFDCIDHSVLPREFHLPGRQPEPTAWDAQTGPFKFWNGSPNALRWRSV